MILRRRNSRKRKNPHYARKTFLLLLALVIMFSLILTATSAKQERVGAHYPLPHPYAVGDTFTLTTRNGAQRTYTVRYAWEDGSNVAIGTHKNMVSHDPETNAYEVWQGCNTRKHGTWKHIEARYRNLERCYGVSIIDLRSN